eukprot:CAMPEP_0178391068 /NCGR_PEP_ID=MMETSP0689_2-20121128/10971_1 /TAXON_ID=160604 /ORGANISM="Amphidinium massartii, Strain CS-259" /LENGTH=163 /DNA_ID=CAMNT_0020011597 /DNA_START=80 /DNA_END=571 /DNA_ORIENTATION=-
MQVGCFSQLGVAACHDIQAGISTSLLRAVKHGSAQLNPDDDESPPTEDADSSQMLASSVDSDAYSSSRQTGLDFKPSTSSSEGPRRTYLLAVVEMESSEFTDMELQDADVDDEAVPSSTTISSSALSINILIAALNSSMPMKVLAPSSKALANTILASMEDRD